MVFQPEGIRVRERKAPRFLMTNEFGAIDRMKFI